MGFASPAEEELADTITVGEYLIRDKDASYLLQMQGDALAESGILNGDFIIFERSSAYRWGDLVVTLGEDGYMVRYFPKGAQAQALQVIGIVTGTFRTYH